MNYELLKQLIIISMSSSVITTAVVQRIKYYVKTNKYLMLISFFVSMILGTLFALTFSDVNFIDSLWVGLFSFAGADAIYKSFEGKFFTSFCDLGEKDSEKTIVKK